MRPEVAAEAGSTNDVCTCDFGDVPLVYRVVYIQIVSIIEKVVINGVVTGKDTKKDASEVVRTCIVAYNCVIVAERVRVVSEKVDSVVAVVADIVA